MWIHILPSDLQVGDTFTDATTVIQVLAPTRCGNPSVMVQTYGNEVFTREYCSYATPVEVRRNGITPTDHNWSTAHHAHAH